MARFGAFYASTGIAAEFGVDGDATQVRPGGSSEHDPSEHRPAKHVLPQRIIRFLDALGATRSEIRAETRPADARYTVRGDEGFVRVEVEAPGGARAWSQPFWIAG